MLSLLYLCIVWPLSSFATYTDYFPPPVTGASTVASKQNKDITLSYKKTEICETSFSGYINIPAASLADAEGLFGYDMNIYFWYFPARQLPDTAPIALWIGGGPGESAIEGAMTENGPCYVNADGNSTRTNPYSRNNKVNVLYVDQPIGAGFSYSSLVNVTYNVLTTGVTPTDFSSGIPYSPNVTIFPGTVANPDLSLTANNSIIAAKAMWQFAQGWFDTFPHLPKNENISLWTNSYGGFFGPAIFKYWDQQNKLIESGKLNARVLQLDTLGIENGCIDGVTQDLSWPEYVYNNTYGLQMINQSVYEQVVEIIADPKDGCTALMQQCRALAAVGDSEFNGNNQTVNEFCSQIDPQCFFILGLAPIYANRNAFDIAEIGPQSNPSYYHVNFFNQRWVQEGLGVPLNFTDNANLTTLYFAGTSDPYRQDQSSVKYLLDNKVQVALVYGDRDSRCSWIGAENVSLTVDYTDAQDFRSAGYANIQTNSSYVGGVVRQYDGFSFSRVFQAGHAVSWFQPQTASEIFERVMLRHDIATGNTAAGFDASGSHYKSKGLSSSWSIKNVLPPSPEPICNLWAATATCTNNQLAAIEDGTAQTKDFLVTSPLPDVNS